ncbi:MAG: NADPH-dependent 7-cyano-7-deazaguanine reductase QueF [Paludibacter sp.]|nr:NADPH-dependent 7-cyano-7-deazaguanine reductase QueF [Paludibacter sp.]
MEEFDIKDSILGKITTNPERYNPSLLFKIPRNENRVHYGIDSSNLNFVGFDVWNCYELSFLTQNGLPVSRVLKLIYSCDSQYLVESKSLKLYLNSFNMEKFGKTVIESVNEVKAIICNDLSQLLETEVRVSLFDTDCETRKPFPEFSDKNLLKMVDDETLNSLHFHHFNETPAILQSKITRENHDYSFYSDLLRSNCRVTNQPDWGDLFVSISTKNEIDVLSIIEYLVSFRKENHFHEEVAEMIYKRFSDLFNPSKLMVAAMYTRRGGIDINPIRASHTELIDETLISSHYFIEKRLRQ